MRYQLEDEHFLPFCMDQRTTEKSITNIALSESVSLSVASDSLQPPNIWALGWIIWRSPSGPGVVGLAEGSVTNEQGVYVPSPPWAECPYNLEDSKGEI